jgi:hypothetical protein
VPPVEAPGADRNVDWVERGCRDLEEDVTVARLRLRDVTELGRAAEFRDDGRPHQSSIVSEVVTSMQPPTER